MRRPPSSPKAGVPHTAGRGTDRGTRPGPRPGAGWGARSFLATIVPDTDHQPPSDRHFFFHTTQTLDYAIVLEGEIWAMMDEGETLMKKGDVLIQRATNHSWSNRTNRDCKMAFVLIDGAGISQQ